MQGIEWKTVIVAVVLSVIVGMVLAKRAGGA